MKKVNYLIMLGTTFFFIQSVQADHLFCPKGSNVTIRENTRSKGYYGTAKLRVCGRDLVFDGSYKEDYKPGQIPKIENEAAIWTVKNNNELTCEYQIEGAAPTETFPISVSARTYTKCVALDHAIFDCE